MPESLSESVDDRPGHHDPRRGRRAPAHHPPGVGARHRPATGHRIVAHLLAERLLADDGPGGLRLGLRLFELGTQAAQSGLTLLDMAAPYLHDLYAALGWTAQLATLDGDDVIYLLKVDGPAHPKLATRVAGRFPPHCTGAGKALLAFLPPEHLDALLPRLPLAPRTPASLTDPAALLADLRVTRRRGYDARAGPPSGVDTGA